MSPDRPETWMRLGIARIEPVSHVMDVTLGPLLTRMHEGSCGNVGLSDRASADDLINTSATATGRADAR